MLHQDGAQSVLDFGATGFWIFSLEVLNWKVYTKIPKSETFLILNLPDKRQLTCTEERSSRIWCEKFEKKPKVS